MSIIFNKLIKSLSLLSLDHLPSLIEYQTAGAFWKPIRKLLNPTFNLKILQSFVPIFNDKTNIMLENLDKETGNKNFDLSKYMHACTLDMVCGKYFSYKFYY